MTDPLSILSNLALGILNFLKWLLTGVESWSKPIGMDCPAPIDNVLARVPINLQCRSQQAFAGLMSGLGMEPGSGAALWLAGTLVLLLFLFIIFLLYKIFRKYVWVVVVILLVLMFFRSI